jgi:hypothetical protein
VVFFQVHVFKEMCAIGDGPSVLNVALIIYLLTQIDLVSKSLITVRHAYLLLSNLLYIVPFCVDKQKPISIPDLSLEIMIHCAYLVLSIKYGFNLVRSISTFLQDAI